MPKPEIARDSSSYQLEIFKQLVDLDIDIDAGQIFGVTELHVKYRQKHEKPEGDHADLKLIHSCSAGQEEDQGAQGADEKLEPEDNQQFDELKKINSIHSNSPS